VRWLSTLISGLFGTSLGCGGGAGSTSGGGSSYPPPSSNAVPAIVTVSPNSSNPGGTDFVLSVVGTNFISSSTVQWNGSTRQTTNSNPQLRLEPLPAPPLVLITSWNEIGEGNHLLPTVEDGTSYGDALAAMLTAP
jgi:hypothetical protein